MAIAGLVHTFDRTNRVKYPALHPLHEEGFKIAELTRHQSAYISMFIKHFELAIPGAAGTGKTVLAMEMAWRLAERGSQVLLLCSNPFLPPWIEEKLIRKDLTAGEQSIRQFIQILDLQGLCRLVEERTVGSQRATNLQRFDTQREIVQFLSSRTRSLAGKGLLFDAIIVDEGQEISPELWAAINKLRKSNSRGRAYFFYDEAQRDMEGAWTVPIATNRIVLPLMDNVRNTQHIFDLMMKFYVGTDAPQCRGPKGKSPEYLRIEELGSSQQGADGETLALQRTLDTLIRSKRIAPEDIMIITCRTQKRSRWFKMPNVGAHKLTWQSDGRLVGRVAVSTIRSAKGLERKYILLTELDGLTDMTDHTLRKKRLYIAISRALLRIIIFGTQEDLLQFA